MSDFRTEIKQIHGPALLDHDTPIMAMGSCFADRMGKRLSEARFPMLINPFGIIYNPYSLSKLLLDCVQGQDIPHFIYDDKNGYWHSFDFHSSLNHIQKEAAQENGRSVWKETKRFLQKTRLLILSLGTVWVYKRKDNGAIVANCHKYPADFFIKERLNFQQITASLSRLIEALQHINPKLQVLLTVSPVRHIRDGLVDNGLSKATLRVACHELATQHHATHYFPAYELMMDDLRDYRFYEADMLHPNGVAEQYIWEKFCESWMSATAVDRMKRWEKLQKGIAHRPFQPQSAAHQNFLKRLLKELKIMHQELDCQEEIDLIESRIARANSAANSDAAD